MKQPWITNVAGYRVREGTHRNPGPNAMLIQITDPPGDFPQAKFPFLETYQFQFLDIEQDTPALDEEMRCQPWQAQQMADLLQRALNNNMNVIVNCHMGICRSGAVCEVGVEMGFEDLHAPRTPNLLVKHLMRKHLGYAMY